MRGDGELGRVGAHRRGDGHAARQGLHRQHGVAVGDGIDGGLRRAGGARHNVHQFFCRGIADVDLEEEAVELGFGQRVGAFQFDGVLRRQHEEGLRQGVGRAAHADLALLHRFQQGGLRLRGGAVDFVGQQQVGEDRARWKRKRALAVVGDLEDVGADDVGGHQVGRELDAGEVELERGGEGAHEHRLAQAGQPFQQQVAVGQQGDERVAHHVALPDDDAARLRLRSWLRCRGIG